MKRYFVPLMLAGVVAMTTGCPDGTPGKEAAGNKWEDVLDELREMDEASMKKNWKRYYKRAISELETKVKSLQEKRITILTETKLKENELKELEPKAAAAKKIVRAAIARYKDQKAAGSASFQIKAGATDELTEAEAKKLIRRWSAEYKRKYADAKITKKVTLARKLRDNAGKIEIAIDAYKDKIEALQEQMANYEVELEMAKITDSLTALATGGANLGSHDDVPSLDQLTSLNKSLDKAIARSEVTADLAKEESDLKAKFSSLESEVNSVGAGLDIDAEFEKELSEIQ
ncbi:MAG: hypothetical protein JKY65_08530 [Planctomycetes bacterium]|nr:hypothetical protein [Planctomycetota bacterium]